MTKRASKALEEICNDISFATIPEKMSPEEALEFLEEIQARLEASIGALKEDLDCRGSDG